MGGGCGNIIRRSGEGRDRTLKIKQREITKITRKFLCVKAQRKKGAEDAQRILENT